MLILDNVIFYHEELENGDAVRKNNRILDYEHILSLLHRAVICFVNWAKALYLQNIRYYQSR